MKRIIALVLLAVIASAGAAFTDSENTIEKDSSLINKSLTFESKLAIDIMDESIEGEGTIKVDGVTMIPLRVVLENLGYEISWNNENQSVDIAKDAISTSIMIDSNSYFKNKMAPWSLSSAPKLIDNKTYVPVEFLFEILGYGMNVDNGILKIQESKMAIQEGYITEINLKEDGITAITIRSDVNSTDPADKLIVNVSDDYSIINTELEVGKHIKAICPNLMTLAVLTEINGFVVYQ